MQKEEVETKVFEAPKILNTYLGQKGYTLYKKDLTIEQQQFIKKELTVKPYTPGMNQQNAKTFPAFREVDKKLYVPRYFGEQYFGKPKESKITLGDDINIGFNGELRDNQKPVVKSFLDHVNKAQTGGGLLDLPCAFGKTSLSLYIVSQLKKKTLVIVHKEFLMNQWIERIQQFLPSARVGKIQGQVIDIENKDIVLGMLQSLSMKDYPATMFDSFGLTIIDEVHHISSEVFSCALFKLVTNYTLGLSATMNRKDGTTHIFKLFLGDIIHKEVRGKDDAVLVRALEYESNNEEFNTVEYDYRGQAKYSTMISKLCEFSARTEFVLRVIGDMLKENGDQQIMVIAHNKNVLKYIFDAIQHRKITTVGYYVGGMKEAALKESENKQVIIATYSMAAEALDIKTLTTLIMVTPKTDIEQAVGRILRAKHSMPVVVDIIDQHEPFQNQWKKRKAYYMKNNYKIIQTCSSTYDADITKWDVIYEPGTSYRKACVRAPKIKPTSEEALQGKCLIKIKKATDE
jgi:superfamily II DNA or RNA helicase